MRSFFIKILAALGIATFLSWGYLFLPEVFFSFEGRLRDYLFVIRGELPKSQNVVIVDIDEKSLKKYGQWPWSRDVVADLLYALDDAEVGIIGLDIVFAEEDRTSPHRFSAYLNNTTHQLVNYDTLLAQAFQTTPVVGGYLFTFEQNQTQNPPHIPSVFVKYGMGEDAPLLKPRGMILNIAPLQDALYSSGFFNNIPDEGGMIRSVPLIMEYDGSIYPSLALELVRIFKRQERVDVVGDSEGVWHVALGELQIPTDSFGRLSVNFRGGAKYFSYISASDVLDQNFDPNLLRGKFVLVGTSAAGLFDLRSTPYANAIAGVEVHANVIDNLLEGDFLSKPRYGVVYDLLIIWGAVFLFFFLFSFLKSWLILPSAFLLFYGMFELFYVLLFEYGIVLNLLFPLLAFVLSFALALGIDYIIASRRMEEAKRMLGKKVSPAVMEYLLEHSAEELVSSRELEATIFFSDIRSFTTISEKIGSPDKVIHMLNTYLTPMVQSIVNHKGTIDKFIGDAIMAYWNAPIPVPNHADQALKSAIEQIEMLTNINKLITPKYDVTINIGIGLHTGIVTAGDMGSYGRSDYTIIGDNVNLASRMEGLTKQYGASILISRATYERLEGSYVIRPLDLVEVKGKNEAVEIFEVICKNKNISKEELESYAKAISLFRSAKVARAHEIFQNLQAQNPSKLYEFYIQRCDAFLTHPELEFTPILKMTTK
jgi:adenylate cyclase